MPLHWTVESLPKLITVVANGDVSRSDIETFLEMISGANLVGWHKLCDARAGRSALTFEDVNLIGVRLRAGYSVQEVGALACVMTKTGPPELGRLLGFLATARRPMRLFDDLKKARKWLELDGIKFST